MWHVACGVMAMWRMAMWLANMTSMASWHVAACGNVTYGRNVGIFGRNVA
jgi:hypothetical protein